MAVCKSVTIPGMTGHVRRNTQLSESDLPFTVDLLDEARISHEFQQRIKPDLMRLE
jgi:hypothetical protein